MTIVLAVRQNALLGLVQSRHDDELRWGNARKAAEQVGADSPILSLAEPPTSYSPVTIGGFDKRASFRLKRDIATVVDWIHEVKEHKLAAAGSVLYLLDRRLLHAELGQILRQETLSMQAQQWRKFVQRVIRKYYDLAAADSSSRTASVAAADVAAFLAEVEAVLSAVQHVTVAVGRCDKFCFGLCLAENRLACQRSR